VKLIKSFMISLVGVTVLHGYTPFDESISYTENEIVVLDGVSYISIQNVPAGTPITSSSYWIPLLNTVPSEPSTTAPDTEPSETGLPNDFPDDNDTDLDGIPNSVEIEIGSDPNVSDSIIFNYALELGISRGVELVRNDPVSYDLMTFSAYELALSEANISSELAIANAMDDGIEEGVNRVLEEPNAYSLFSMSELAQATSQGIQSVLANPTSYDLIRKIDHEEIVEGFQISGDSLNNPYTNGWFFVPDRGWLWTTTAVFPWIYDHRSRNWFYFQKGQSMPVFFDNNLQQWIDWSEFTALP
jgi:hypothetical protein